MFKADLDVEKNRLYLFIGNIQEKEEFGNAIAETERLVRFLKQGFTCISDLRGFKFRDKDHYFMQSIQETLWDSGVKLVIRIVDKSCVKRFSFEKKSAVWPGYETETVFSGDDAEYVLIKRGL